MSAWDRVKALFSGTVPGTVPASVQNPPSAEVELVRYLRDRWLAAMQGGNQCNPRYDDYLNRWRREYRLPDRAEFRANLLSGAEFAGLETKVSLLTGNLPRPEIEPADDPKLAFLGPVWQAMVTDWWERYDVDEVIEDLERISDLNGYADIKVGWNSMLAGTLGDIEAHAKDPRLSVFDHEAKSFKDSRYSFDEEWFTPEEMLEIFGKRAIGMTANSAGGEGGLGGMASEAETSVQNERIRVIRCLWQDLSTELVAVDVPANEPAPEGPDEEFEEEKEPEGGAEKPDEGEELNPDFEQEAAEAKALDPIKVRKMKYPTGRISIFSPDDDRLLWDGPNPYPWVRDIRLDNYKDPHKATGVADMDLTQAMQDVLDAFLSNVADQQDQSGNPKLINPTNSGIPSDQITGAPGEVLPVNPGAADLLRYLLPPPIPEYALNFPDVMEKWMEKASGIHEVMQGQRPGGLDTFATLRALQQSGMSRIAPKAKRIGRVIKQMTERVIYLMQTRYHTARKFVVAGEAGEQLRSICQDIQKQALMQQQSGFPQKSDVGAMPEEILKFLGQSGKSLYFECIAAGLPAAMRVKVETGDLIMTTQAEMAAQAQQMFKDGAIDQRAYLKAVKWQNAESIIQRMEQKAAAAQQAQLQAKYGQQQGQQGQQPQGFNGAPATEQGQQQAQPEQQAQQAPQQQQGKPEDAGVLKPDYENPLLAQGHALVVHPQDDDQTHIHSHAIAAQQAPGPSRTVFVQHIKMHQQQQAQKQQGQQGQQQAQQAPGGIQ